MCGTTSMRGAGVWAAKAEPIATGRGPAHSLVPEDHTLDASAEENHAAEVCSRVKESWTSVATAAPAHSPHRAPGTPSPSLRTPAAEVSCRVQTNPLNVCMCVRVDVYVHACVVCLHMPGGNLNIRKCLLPAHPPATVPGLGKDTDKGSGNNGQNGPHWDGFLRISEVPRAVGASHDASKNNETPSGAPLGVGAGNVGGQEGSPVTEGKKMPTSTVKDVAMSATTYRGRLSFKPRASVEGSPCFSTTSPFSR